MVAEKVAPTIDILDTNRLRVTFSSAAQAEQYRVVIIGFGVDAGTEPTPPTPPARFVHSTQAPGNTGDPVTRKYDEDGNLIWTIDDTGTFPQIGRSVAVDKDGYVYVAGDRFAQAEMIFKHAPDGTQEWSVAAFAEQIYPTIAVASDGRVLIGSARQSIGGGLYATTQLFDEDGVSIWTYDHGDTIWRVAFGPEGNIYMAGEWGTNNATLRCVNGAGVAQWYHEDATDYVVGLAVAPDGYVYTLSYTGDMIRKISSAGVEVTTGGWPVTVPDLWAGLDLAVDADGGVYVTHEPYSAETDPAVRKYDAGGNLVWSASFGWWPNGICVTPEGSVYVGGHGGTWPAPATAFIRKYDASDGTEITVGWPADAASGGIIYGIAVSPGLPGAFSTEWS